MSARIHAAGAHEVDVWLAFHDEVSSDALAAHMRATLSAEERLRALRFHFEDDRLRYRVTRALVRTVLSRYAPVAPAAWEFDANAYGRPEIAVRFACAGELRFNVSHTHNLTVLGVTRWRTLGIDVECLRRREVAAEVAQRFFAPSEAAELARLPVAQRPERFFEYWTFKESYIKARGMGLSLPLDKFRFDYPHRRRVELRIDPELGDRDDRWTLWQYRPTQEHLLAICAERIDHDIPNVRLLKTDLAAVVEPLQLNWSRASAAADTAHGSGARSAMQGLGPGPGG